MTTAEPNGQLDRVLRHIGTLGHPGAWPEPDGYPGLALCVLNAVWSIGVRYGGVRNVVARCRKLVEAEGRDAERDGPREFFVLAEELGSPDAFAAALNNRQRTSSRNGILKAEAVQHACRVLDQAGVTSNEELLALGPDELEDLRARFVVVRGQGSGLSFDYILMLAGRPGVKADRMIRRFVAEALGLRSENDVSLIDARELVVAAAAAVGVDAHRLDHAIWNAQSQGSSTLGPG